MKEFLRRYTVKQYLIAASIIAVGFIIYLGFNDRVLETSGCTSNASVYMSADFSEIESGIDFEGEFYSETNYWSDPVSETYYVNMVNMKIIGQNIEETVKGLTLIPSTDFYYDKSASNESNFDKFSLVTKHSIKQLFTSGDNVSIDENQYESCINSIGMYTTVMFWYGVPYGI